MKQFIDVPLPKWKNLLSALISFKNTDNEIIKSWVSNKDLGFSFSRSSWSLYFIAKLRQQYSGKDKITIWVPDYFCDSALKLLRTLKVTLIFYPIRENNLLLKKDLTIFLKNNPKPDLFIATHYFGKKINLDASLDFCEVNNIWLIEDCVHIFKNIKHESKSHFKIFSPYKYLAIPDGAILVINMNKFLSKDKIFFTKAYKNLLNEFELKISKTYLWFFKRIFQKLGYRRKLKFSDFNNDGLSDVSSTLPGPKISNLSLKLLASEPLDFESEQEIRWKNYRSWRNKIHDELFPELEIISPYLFPYSFVNLENEPKITNLILSKKLKELKKAKIPFYSWPDLPPEVEENPENHKFAINLKRQIIFLPIHSSINPYDLLMRIDRLNLLTRNEN